MHITIMARQIVPSAAAATGKAGSPTVNSCVMWIGQRRCCHPQTGVHRLDTLNSCAVLRCIFEVVGLGLVIGLLFGGYESMSMKSVIASLLIFSGYELIM